MKGPTKAQNDRNGANTGKNEEKGAYEGQNEGNRPSKKIYSAIIKKKYLRPTRALIRPCLGGVVLQFCEKS
jgi:hypothetical protein